MKYLPLLLPLALSSCTVLTSPLVPGAKTRDHGSIGAVEGPAWKDGSLYFTDGKHINRMGPDGRVSVFRHNASNGLLFDREGRLVACETKKRRVTRTEKDGSITVLADRFLGKRFNSPNDLCMDSKGLIYFTDPRYGSRAGMEIFDQVDGCEPSGIKPGQMPIEGVYRINRQARLPDGLCAFAYDIPNVTRILCEGAERPNGILITPDDRFLYIADNNNNTRGGSRKLLRYELDEYGDVKPGTRRVIFDWKDGRGPDGMKMDAKGRIYVAAGTNKPTEYETTRYKAGCYILSGSGRLLDFVPTAPDECCNCAFGGADGKTLFITSGGNLWSAPLR
ncbi:MAG TPA: gluconolactonase [Verrucomicrobiales bacterium]|nr:gluconolactonase [Verrucomicrobiales bacterium]HRJ08237.1 SMP-30/gluconolactonase/LRE family protein [Prosthecobacter sp.]HRK16481.1 SMP-30/gluconolactonase/LRE family protein [Prosthecobacter sp.]